MLEATLRYVKRAPQVAAVVVADPAEAWTRLRTKFVERREHRRPPCRYVPEPDWERRLHRDLGLAWPCPMAAEFWALWPAVIAGLRAKGMRIGPAAFGIWNDGDPELVRAVWCLTRHLRPDKIVETGVARGLTTRFILEALERNGCGRLWSIDLPPALERQLRGEVGAAVEDRLRHRWTYIEGSSRRRLPALLSRLGEIGLFIHDSMHTEHNVRFEMDLAWSAMRPGGALVVDDIDLNWGFRSFGEVFRDHPRLCCQAQPLQPDPRRFDSKGLFGIVRKRPGDPAASGRRNAVTS